MAKNDDKDRARVLRKKVKGLIGWAIGIGVLGTIVYAAVTAPRIADTELESTVGLHYHPRLVITINGEKLTIPNNIGIGVVHNPIHTHEEGDGTLHLEFEGAVRKEDIKLGDFFTVWEKEWTATSFMGMPIGDGHMLSMKVNGTPSTEYGNHLMKDGDLIELDYR